MQMPTDTDIVDDPVVPIPVPNRAARRQQAHVARQSGRQFLNTAAVLERFCLRSPVSLNRLIEREPDFPQAIIFSGHKYWHEEEIDQFMASRPRGGQGRRPNEAIAERRRRIADRRVAATTGPVILKSTGQIGFVRRAPLPGANTNPDRISTNRFQRGN